MKDGEVLNDPSVALLADAALSHARAGAGHRCAVGHDGRPRGRDSREARRERIRRTSPFFPTPRNIAPRSTARFAKPRNPRPSSATAAAYQMDPANAREALREVELDLEEGADIIMVKPALPYLDIIQRVRERFDVPVAAYNVSAEFSMVKAAAQNGWIDEQRITLEILTGIQRAGASIILTYHAKDVARWLKHC